jgi:protein-tyrosine phosphatase
MQTTNLRPAPTLAIFLALTACCAFGGLEQKSPPVPPADAGTPLLVWDIAPDLRAGLPRNFRTTSDPLKVKDGPKPDATGLAALRASGSAEFNEAGFRLMLAQLRGPVTVFDLRQEDHVFVNGEPVSWYATNNWANVGKSHDAVVAGETARVASCKIGDSLELADDKGKKGGDATPAEHVTLARAQTEREVVAAAGAAYVRLTVSDHSRPLDDEVDRFILAVRAMPADGWAHFHCRAGKGRTTTFLALYDMLRNAPRVALADIVNRQSLLIGDYNLLAKEADEAWKAGVTADRAEFVRAFYDYARANPDGRPQLWSEWLKSASAPAK